MAFSPRVKPEQDSEDLFMSYLNTDCMSSSDNSSTPWSSPRKSVILTPTGENDLWCPNYFAAVAAAARQQPYSSCLPQAELLAAMPMVPYIQPMCDEPQQPKRKRGRKKRDISPPSSNTLAIAPAPTTVVNTLPTTTPDLGDNNNSNSNNNSEDEKAVAALAKRQERLIKNRAAALLSRKRKREHVNALEEQNGLLKAQVSDLESRVQSLTLALHQKSSATTSVVLMIILFSFAIFSLPRTGKPLIRSASNEKESTKVYLDRELWDGREAT